MQPLLAALLCVYTLDAPRVYEQPIPYQHIFAVDFDGDGHLDLGVANSVTFTIRYGFGDGKLSEPQTIDMGVVGIGDLTGDRLPDLIGPGTRVAENRGNRLFAPPQRRAESGAFVTADFTSDGREDLLILNASMRHVTLYVHGPELLESQSPRALTQPAGLLETGDVNGDGHADLIAVRNDGGYVHVLYGDGRGNFADPVEIVPNWPVVDVTAADLDRDGRDDVIVGEQFDSASRVEVFYAGEAPSVTILLPDYSFGKRLAVEAHDITGDGAPDVLASVGVEPMANRVLVNDGHGLLTVAEPVIRARRGPATAGDFDEDGAADLVLASGAGFRILPWNGGAPYSFLRKLGPQFTSGFLTAGDVNQDGLDDFVFFDEEGALRVAINDGTGKYALETIPGRLATLHFRVTISSGEVVVTTGSTVRVFRRTANGVWVERLTHTASSVLQAYTGDLGIDGFKELVVLDNEPAKTLRIYSGSTGNLIQEVALGAHLYASFAVDDMNGDGRPDLIVTTSGASNDALFVPSPLPNGAVQILYGRGDATFRAPVTIAFERSPLRAHTGDFNGDGRRDLVYTLFNDGLIVQYGTATGFTAPAMVLGRDPFLLVHVTARDLNEDGITDLLTGFDMDYVTLFGTRAGLVRGGIYWVPSGNGGVPVKLAHDRPVALLTWDWKVVEGRCAPPRGRRVRH